MTRAGRDEAEALFSDAPGHAGPLVVIHPGSGDNFQGRRWPVASFAGLADRLVEHEGARVVVTGTIVRTHDSGKATFLNFAEDWKGTFTGVVFAAAECDWPAPPGAGRF